jgi:phosphoribosylaminoimidazole-succinocarboxamide synthase
VTPSTLSKALLETKIDSIPLLARGKVRDIYDLGDKLLFVATDRVSAFDVVLPNGIPDKGKLLTQISVFWFDFLKELMPTHFITADVNEFPAELRAYDEQLTGRSMIVRKAERVDVECVVRGYISGSLWKELKEARSAGSGSLLGFDFPESLQESEKFPEPIFTPATKNDVGHDENISFAAMIDAVGKETAELCRDKSMEIYTKASDFARARGIILADTKFEFGFIDGQLALIDEVLTPDSSRFWPADKYEIGKGQPSYDKQFVRDYLLTLDWDKTAPGPELPQDIIERTAEKYREIIEKLSS